MGNTRLVHYASALAALTLLSGCDLPHAWRESDIDARIETRVRPLEVRAQYLADKTAELQGKVQVLESENNLLRTRLGFTERVNDAISKQVANNAKVANQNAIKDMTRRGACGSDLVQTSPGVFYNRPRPCTEADLTN